MLNIPKGAILLDEASAKLRVPPKDLEKALVTELGLKPSTAARYIGRGYIPSQYRTRLDELSGQKDPTRAAASLLVLFESGFRLQGVDFIELARAGQVENVRLILAMYERLAVKALDSARGRDIDDPPSPPAKRVAAAGE